ncbi:MAG: RNA polymerase sigma factor [Patescibacteria group bacterium]|nr:RNA polymerase sigma factor [Patescibacteria group bacterium]MDE2116299.1 RNA polymerase sigma factor [Patescibacteria group bacterium]
MNRTDGELMEAAKSGDIRSFDELIGRYTDRVYAFALRLSGESSVAEDAVQETFIKLWKNRSRYDEKRNFSSWLFAIARNATLDQMRKRRDIAFSSVFVGESEESFGEDISDESIAIPEDIDRRTMAGILEETLQSLTPDQRAIVLLHDIERMTFDEAGKALGKPLNTVKSHYRRAIIALRRKLADRGLM